LILSPVDLSALGFKIFFFWRAFFHSASFFALVYKLLFSP